MLFACTPQEFRPPQVPDFSENETVERGWLSYSFCPSSPPNPPFQDLLRRKNFPPYGRPRLLAPPFLTCASDAIPFRTYTVAESTGIHGHKGAQPFRPPLPDCACETSFPENRTTVL
jgi:hypothetical protein